MTGEDPVTCAGREWLATAFAVGDLDGSEWAEMASHLNHCASCRAEVASLTDVLDRMAALAPPRKPSEGFTERVVDALAGPTTAGVGSVTVEPAPATGERTSDIPWVSPAPPPGAATTRGPGRSGRSRVRRVAAATVVAGAVAGVALFAVFWPGQRAHRPIQSSFVAEMRTGQGDMVGQVVVFDERPAVVTVALDIPAQASWGAAGPYEVVAVQRDGRDVRLGTVRVVGGRGSLQTSSPVSASDIAAVEVRSAGGQDLCAGLVPHGSPRGQWSGSGSAPPPPPPGG